MARQQLQKFCCLQFFSFREILLIQVCLSEQVWFLFFNCEKNHTRMKRKIFCLLQKKMKRVSYCLCRVRHYPSLWKNLWEVGIRSAVNMRKDGFKEAQRHWPVSLCKEELWSEASMRKENFLLHIKAIEWRQRIKKKYMISVFFQRIGRFFVFQKGKKNKSEK